MDNEKLIEQVRNGFHIMENMQALYENNLPLLKQFVRPYTCYEPEEDLLQEAYFGLWEATKYYESSKNVKFMTYAHFWIRQSIVRYIENCGSIIRRPSGFKQKMNRYNKTVQDFAQVYGRIPTDREMAEVLDISLQKVEEIKIALQEVASLDAPLKADEELSLADTVADDFSLEDDTVDKIFNEYQQSELWGIVERYTDNQQEQVIRKYYKEGKTLSEIARESGISLERVRQYRAAGLRRLRMSKSLREIREKCEVVEASAYRSGFNGFKEHGDSIVEHIALRRAELEQRYKSVMNV